MTTLTIFVSLTDGAIYHFITSVKDMLKHTKIVLKIDPQNPRQAHGGGFPFELHLINYMQQRHFSRHGLHNTDPATLYLSLLILLQTSFSAAARLSPAADAHFFAVSHTPSSSPSPVNDNLLLGLSATKALCAAR